MSTKHNTKQRREIEVVEAGNRRAATDIRKLSRALIQIARAQAEADAKAEHDKQRQGDEVVPRG